MEYKNTSLFNKKAEFMIRQELEILTPLHRMPLISRGLPRRPEVGSPIWCEQHPFDKINPPMQYPFLNKIKEGFRTTGSVVSGFLGGAKEKFHRFEQGQREITYREWVKMREWEVKNSPTKEERRNYRLGLGLPVEEPVAQATIIIAPLDTPQVAGRPFLERARDLVRPASEFVLGNGKTVGELVRRVSATSLRWGEKVDSRQTQILINGAEDKQRQVLLKRVTVIKDKRIGVLKSINERQQEIKSAKDVLDRTYAGVNSLKVDGRDIFRSSRRYKEDPDKVLNSKIRCLVKAFKHGNSEWFNNLPIDVRYALVRLTSGQKALTKDNGSLRRYELQLKKFGIVEEPNNEPITQKIKPQAPLVRKAVSVGMVGMTAAVLFFIGSVPDSPFKQLGGLNNPNKVVAETATGNPAEDVKDSVAVKTPAGFVSKAEYDKLVASEEDYHRRFLEAFETGSRLQTRALTAEDQNKRYKKQVADLQRQLAKANPSSPAAILQYQVDSLVKKNHDLSKDNNDLRQQLAEAQAATTSPVPYYEHRGAQALTELVNKQPVDTIPPQVQEAFIANDYRENHALRAGETLLGIAGNIGNPLQLDQYQIYLLAREIAMENRIASEYLATVGEDPDTNLPTGRELRLKSAMVLVAQLLQS